MKQVLFVAAENAALPGGKVGGIGDVIRDLPVALAGQGWATTVLTPAYGALHELPGVVAEGSIAVDFAGQRENVQVYRLPGEPDGVAHRVLDHPHFAPSGAGTIYDDDGPHRPFATDASKFAFLCAAAATYIRDVQQPDVVHLHDWHAALLLLLRESDPQFAALRDIPCVYTIHNLALQGIRPLDGDASSLAAWFPNLAYNMQDVVDPRYADCINPMALGIRLADRVNTVSPTYAREVLQPDDPAAGFLGAEGLESVTRAADAEGRLVGILNGCMYPKGRRPHGWQPLARELKKLQAGDELLQRFSRRRPRSVVTSVGRVTAQKVGLLLQPVETAPTALDAILQSLGDDSVFVMLGSGDPQLEADLHDVCNRHNNALFVNSFSEGLANHLYDCGDLFLMPSTFEPCGISQLLAMRAGQPCVVHGVGGLRDTVSDGETGFVFHGDTPAAQAEAFVATTQSALQLRAENPDRWQAISRAAAKQRFTWDDAACAYIAELYSNARTVAEEKTYATGH
ncbi:MAG: glycogen synthase [Gammaproteobacteria bacterium]|nr:glycogen synthase [Gammaproteobacteria bacterium]